MWKQALLVLCVCVMVCVCQGQGRPNPAGEPELASAQQHKHYNFIAKDNKMGMFLAAAVGTITLMGVVYCIYNQFYTKHPYLHTQLQDDSDISLDLRAPSHSVFPGCAGRVSGQLDGWMGRGLGGSRAGYGSLSDTPSIITLPPSLSPPPIASPYPPFSRSKPAPLRTISAQDLEKSFL